MAIGLTPNQLKQLRALAQAEAFGDASARHEFDLAYCSANVLAILQSYGLTGSRVKGPSGGGRRTHYWLTPAGKERLLQEASRG